MLLISYEDVNDETNMDQNRLLGGKGYSTAIMHRKGFQVPRGRILSTEAFKSVLESAGVLPELNAFFTPTTSEESLGKACERIRSAIIAAEIDDKIQESLRVAFEDLIVDAPEGLIVRSSATVEDTPRASFAGLLSSFPSIRNLDEIVIAVRKCWASIFTPEAHLYLKEHNLLGVDIGVAVLMQIMVPAERSGIIFTEDPVTGDIDKVVIDAIFGLGEELVSGEVTPERYIYSRKRNMIVSRQTGRQTEFLSAAGTRKPVIEEYKQVPKLSDSEIYELAEIGVKLENIFGRPQDIEWSFGNGSLYVLQSRPIVIGELYEKLFPQIGEETVLLKGNGVSPKVGSGRVMIMNADSIPEVDQNTVVVAERITNDLAVHLRRAAGVITDEGGATSHGANILREFNVPCVLATSNATEMLHDGQIVTVDGLRGFVYQGDLSVRILETTEVPETQTKIFVSVLIPEKARHVAALADGVSSLRDDYFMLELGTHPLSMIKEGQGIYLEDNITNGIIQTLSMFEGKPVWYKTMDAPTNEFRRLKGSEDPKEENPLLGWRGIGRELDEPEMLKLEFRAVRRALGKADGALGIKLPFIRFVDEFVGAKRILREIGLRPHVDVKIGISIENPGVVFTIDDFINEGIDFISIGLSDLVMTTLAIDRESQKVSGLFKPDHPAVFRLLEEIASVAQQNGVFTCVAGESARDPSILPKLVSLGFDAIGVSLSFFSEVKHEVARIESRIY